MQKPQIKKQTLTKRLLPVMLSAVVAISATAAAGMLTAKDSAAETKTAPPAKTTPATPAKTDKKDGKPVVKVSAAEIDASIASATKVEPLDLLKTPDQYLNKKVTFTATFNRFADIALDYKKAFRDSRDYVTFFILRPDVTEHTIPLAEMKLFFPRKQSDEVMELEAGDKIQVVGTEFSTALEEPWIDVEHIKILEKTAKSERRKEPAEF